MNGLPLQFLALILAGWVNPAQQDVIEYLQEENRALRDQLGGRRIRITDVQRRRLAERAKKLGRRKLLEICTLVTPDTLLRRYRELIAQKYDGSKKRGPGRLRTSAKIEQLILVMARDNTRWGYTRIKDALHNLGFEIGQNTIKRVLVEHGIDPAPLRGTSWRTFLKAHWGAISATDFFAVEIVTWRGLVRYLVLLVIDLKTRRIVIAGMSPSPDGQWLAQLARNLTDAGDGFLTGSRYLIHDRDPPFTNSNELIDRRSEDYSGCGSIECRERVGGVLRHFRRAAQASAEFWHITGRRCRVFHADAGPSCHLRPPQAGRQAETAPPRRLEAAGSAGPRSSRPLREALMDAGL